MNRITTVGWVVGLLAATAAPGLPGADAVRATALAVPPGGRPGFTLLRPAETGVTFTNRLSDDRAAENQIRLNGSGVALADVDGDGRVDVFLCGLESPNRLYRNLGNWRFAAAPADAPYALPGSDCSGAAFADVDGDGDADLLVNALGEGTRLFLNDGRGAFSPVPDAGLDRRGGASSLALGDLDGDGDLDLYVANYRTTTIRTTGFALHNVGGRRSVPPELKDDLEITAEGRVLEHGEPDSLYLNEGRGRFRKVAWDSGRFRDEQGEPLRKAPRDWGLSVAFRDLNQDGAPDLYVANDFHSPDRIWINDGTGAFDPIAPLALRHTSTFSMSADFGDLDRDGWDDFFLSDMLDPRRERRMAQVTAMEPNPGRIGVYDDRPQYDRNTLFRNRGDGTYAEIAPFAGLEAAGWSWSAGLLDVDLDGWEDLLFTTGHLFDTQDLDAAARIERLGPFRRDQIPRKLLMYPRLAMPKAAFRNLGGMRFADAAADWGFDDVGVAHGMAFADLDDDGDLDVVVNNLNAPAGLYRNECPAPRVAVRLLGALPNTAGVGARVSLVSGTLRQDQEIQAGGRYLSSDAPARTFAWPAGGGPARIVVAWRSGRVSTVEQVRPNHRYTLVEPIGPPPQDPDPSLRHPPIATEAGWFADTSNALLGHRHTENAFDDFARQPLLPRRLSQSGPAVAWHDLDGDGWEDLILGAGAGGRLAVLRNNRAGGFTAADSGKTDPPEPRDLMGIVADPLHPRGLLLAASAFEEGAPEGVSLFRFDPADGRRHEVLRDMGSTVGTLAVTDVDADGDLDVFVAGRSVPGRYPEPAASVLLRREADRLVPDEAFGRLAAASGLVTGAVWTDLDGNGWPDLVVSLEWGGLRVARNEGGRLSDWDPVVTPAAAGAGAGAPPSAPVPLSRLTGWWSCVVSGDLDGDGRPDLVAGNWGLNTTHRPTPGHPVRLWFGDFDESGSVDLLEASFDRRLGKEVPDRDLFALRQAVPGVMARFTTHAEYAVASVADILGSRAASARSVEAAELRTVMLLNRGDRFEIRPLPDEAQWSPVQGAVVADFDGDGDQDVFLAQNFHAVQPVDSRQDAGRGLLLRQDGPDRWHAVPGDESGLILYGEQRGCAAADYDQDGRLDLVVGQNGADTRLFHNDRARPALRVRVQGPPANPHGIGTALRRVRGGDRGPRFEIQSGAGSLSHSSPVALLALPAGVPADAASSIEARFPGGKTVTIPVPAGASSLTIPWP